MDWTAHQEYLKAILKEFNPIAGLNKDVLIWYFWDNLCPSIQTQSDKRGKHLDMWNKVIQKANLAKARAYQ